MQRFIDKFHIQNQYNFVGLHKNRQIFLITLPFSFSELRKNQTQQTRQYIQNLKIPI